MKEAFNFLLLAAALKIENQRLTGQITKEEFLKKIGTLRTMILF